MYSHSLKLNRHIPSSPPSRPPPRAHFVLASLGLLFLVLIGRTVYLQVAQQDFLVTQGEARFRRTLIMASNRGVITDRHGEPLAISTPVETVWASPADMDPVPPAKLRELARILEMSPEKLDIKLADRGREFVYLKRQIDPQVADKAMAVGIAGIAKQQEYRRFYPAGEIVSHMIGFTGVDGKGQEGIELAQEKRLSGADGHRVVLKDRRGQIIEDVAAIRPPHDGETISLAVDYRMQYLAYRELKSAVEKNKAKAGSAVVLDARTGELLALANYPSFNPNNRIGLSTGVLRNRAMIDLFEPGSVMKPLSIAAAIDSGKANLQTVLDTRSYFIGSAPVRDVALSPSLNIEGIVKKSSNVGASKLALRMPPQAFSGYLHAFGFGQEPNTGFPGEASGRIRSWKTWRPIEQATMSFGYGFAVSLLQMARAYTVFANDGVMLPVSLYKTSATNGHRVLSRQTAQAMRDVLVANGQIGGGAAHGRIIGYSIGGKSGTVRKLERGAYVTDKHRALFLGFAPGKHPRVIVAVMIDEPTAGKYYGGVVAAPVLSNIAGGVLRVLNVQPDEPFNNTVLPESTPVPMDF